MKLAIISDIHDNLANLERFLDIFKKDCATLSVTQGEESCGIICCGDVTTPETLEYLVGHFDGLIKLVCGNAEIERGEFGGVAEKYKNLEVFADVGEWGVGGLNIAFVHRPNKTRELALSGKYGFVFYGHTHKPWIEETKDSRGESSGVLVANPGTLGGVFTAPTFAIFDTETFKLELKRLYL